MPNQRGSGSTWPKRRKTFRSGNCPLFAGGAIFYFPDALSAAALPVPDAADRAVAEILEPRSLYPPHKTRKPHAIQPAPRPPGPTVSFYGRISGMLYRRFRLQTSSSSPLRAAPARTSPPSTIVRGSCCERRIYSPADNGLHPHHCHCRPFASGAVERLLTGDRHAQARTPLRIIVPTAPNAAYTDRPRSDRTGLPPEPALNSAFSIFRNGI